MDVAQLEEALRAATTAHKAQMEEAKAIAERAHAVLDALRATVRRMEAQEVGQAMDCAASERQAVEAFRAAVLVELSATPAHGDEQAHVLQRLFYRISASDFGARTLKSEEGG